MLGAVYTLLYGSLLSVCFGADWNETLANAPLHAPIFTKAYPTVALIAVAALAGGSIPSDETAGMVFPGCDLLQ